MDREEVGIIRSLEEIQRLSEENFRAHLHQCIRKSSLKWLNDQKKSKTQGVQHNTLQLQKYLLPNSLNNQQKKLLFLLRSKMVDVRDNFRERYKNDKICKICNTEVENQEHVLLCTEITQHANVLIDDQVEVSDIFADEVEKQSRITVLFETLWTLRSKIIKEREIKTN